MVHSGKSYVRTSSNVRERPGSACSSSIMNQCGVSGPTAIASKGWVIRLLSTAQFDFRRRASLVFHNSVRRMAACVSGVSDPVRDTRQIPGRHSSHKNDDDKPYGEKVSSIPRASGHTTRHLNAIAVNSESDAWSRKSSNKWTASLAPARLSWRYTASGSTIANPTHLET